MVPAREVMDAQSVPKKETHQAALSGKMAKISSLRESKGEGSEDKNSYKTSKATSTLPAAMARVHRQHQEDEIRERLRGSTPKEKKLVRKPSESADVQVEDPDPGLGLSTLWFWFSYGKFAKSVLLVQPLQVTVLFWLICGFGFILSSVGFLAPLPGPGPVYNSTFAAQVMGGGILLGLLFYLLGGELFYLVVKKKFGGVSHLLGLKVVVNAFLPLAFAQLITMGVGTFMLGEPYWRGEVPPGYTVFSEIVIPFAWIWGGYRVAQALTGLFSLPFPSRMSLKTAVVVLCALPMMVWASGVSGFMQKRVNEKWELLNRDAKASAQPLPISRFDEVLVLIPFRDTERKQRLYLFRMQAYYRLDQMDAARADALRLDRMAIPTSAEDELAKGLNYLFQNRLDLAIPRFESAIAKDSDCAPAHQWLALGQVGTHIDRSEHHARILMQSDPNVFHLQLLVRILYVQEKYQDIWDVMLMVEAPPDTWDPVTLYQGSVASSKIGKPRRAEFLEGLARGKGLETEGE